MALAATPALNTDDVIALADDTKLDTVRDGPLETAVDILLPALEVEVGLLLGEQERPYAAIQMGILFFLLISGGDQLRDRDELTREAAALRVTMMIGQTGRYLERRRAVLPLFVHG